PEFGRIQLHLELGRRNELGIVHRSRRRRNDSPVPQNKVRREGARRHQSLGFRHAAVQVVVQVKRNIPVVVQQGGQQRVLIVGIARADDAVTAALGRVEGRGE